MPRRIDEQNKAIPPRPQPLVRVLRRSRKAKEPIAEAPSDLTEVNDQLAREVAARSRLSAELATVKHTLEEVRDHLSEVQANEAEARRLALHDPLTGLANRALFEENLAHGMALGRRHGWSLAVLFIDIDKFKTINDRFGHGVGDAVLRRVATCLTSAIREGDTVSRWGGDEFSCLLLEITSEVDAVRVAMAIAARLAEECDLGDATLSIGASIGMAMYPQDGESAEVLFHHADQAMYHAKQTGRQVMLFRECCTN